MIYEAAAIVAAYLLGSIPFGLLIPRLYGVGDIRKVGSGNIGATNVLRACGVSGALIVTVLDIAKGAGPVIAAGILFKDGGYLNHDYLGLIVGMAAVIGHIYPLYLVFEGGKGVNTALGVFFGPDPDPDSGSASGLHYNSGDLEICVARVYFGGGGISGDHPVAVLDRFKAY